MVCLCMRKQPIPLLRVMVCYSACQRAVPLSAERNTQACRDWYPTRLGFPLRCMLGRH